MTKQERLYGKLVVDFANAETATEAVYKALDNLGYAFSISSHLIDQIKALDWESRLSETIEIIAVPHNDLKERKGVQKSETIISSEETKVIQVKRELQDLFESVLRGDDLDKNEPFLEFLGHYNGMWGGGNRRGQLAFDSEGFLHEVAPFDEENLYESIGTWGCSSFVTYCLIHFMKLKHNRKYIGRCQHCQNYFIATRLNNQRFCNRQCQQKAYHSRPEVKREKAAARRKKYGWQPRINAN